MLRRRPNGAGSLPFEQTRTMRQNSGQQKLSRASEPPPTPPHPSSISLSLQSSFRLSCASVSSRLFAASSNICWKSCALFLPPDAPLQVCCAGATAASDVGSLLSICSRCCRDASETNDEKKRAKLSLNKNKVLRHSVFICSEPRGGGYFEELFGVTAVALSAPSFQNQFRLN